jgi:hypothetical protein
MEINYGNAPLPRKKLRDVIDSLISSDPLPPFMQPNSKSILEPIKLPRKIEQSRK